MPHADEDTVEAEVRVDDLARHCNPFDGQEWDCSPIPREEVLDRVARGELEFEPWQVVNIRHRSAPLDDVSYHAGRIACLYANPDRSPLDIGMEGHRDAYGDCRRVRLFDGNHRLAAAILRMDETVRVKVMEWELEALREFLPSLRVVGPGPACGPAC